MSDVLLYGVPAPGLIEVPKGAIQLSPLVPGSQDAADLAVGGAESALVLAPGGTLERDYVVAQVLRALKPGAPLTVFAPKDKGGSRLKKVLERFGCKVAEDARRHHRFAMTTRPADLVDIDAAIAAGAPRILADLGVWSQPGVFSWDRIDPGSARLLEALPAPSGKGADLGCGVGLLSGRVLASPAVTALTAVDIDRRAIACAQRNLHDPRAKVVWSDVRRLADPPTDLDFVVMNPPFHDAGSEDRNLGVAFINTARAMLKKGGVCWLVANRHLPYEAPLSAFSRVDLRAEGGGYKIFQARK